MTPALPLCAKSDTEPAAPSRFILTAEAGGACGWQEAAVA